MPVPKRCAGAKHLFNVYGVPVPNGKCDTGVDFLYDDFQWDGMSWNATAGASANDLSFSMHAMSSVFVSSLNTSRPVRSGTHIYVNELPFY